MTFAVCSRQWPANVRRKSYGEILNLTKERNLFLNLELLKQKQATPKNNKKDLPIEHPIVGFERDLVRVIANMTYKNKGIQNKVFRTFNCITISLSLTSAGLYD